MDKEPSIKQQLKRLYFDLSGLKLAIHVLNTQRHEIQNRFESGQLKKSDIALHRKLGIERESFKIEKEVLLRKIKQLKRQQQGSST